MIFNLYKKPGDLEEPVSHARCKSRSKELFETWEHRDATIGDNFPTVNDFYRGRHLFVTGGSGFCGKVIVEKLLRSCPDVGNIYLLVRPGRGGQHPADRVKDMLQLPLFDRLREENPAALGKVLAVRGDCMQKGLGLSPEDRQLLADKVSIVIHSAASVRFNDALKKAVTMNVLSTIAVVELAREMKRLSVLVHISTAYCNTNNNPTMEKIYPTEHNWRDVVKYANLPDADVLDDLGEKFMGFQPNSYVFTKALAEQVMNEAGRDLPVIIIRPSIVTCALDEPMPGWMDNLNGFAIFWAVVSKGVFRIHYTKDIDMQFDLIPVDTVAKLTILASWAKGTGLLVHEPSQPGDTYVLNATVGDVKPSTYSMMQTTFRRNLEGKRTAYPGVVRFPDHLIVTNKLVYYVLELFYHTLFGAIVDTLLAAFGQKPQLMPTYRKIAGAFAALSYFQENAFTFESDNKWRLVGMLHPRDRKAFNFYDERGELGHWDDISRDQLLGVCRYALKEPIRDQADLDKNYKLVRIFWWLEACWYFFLAAVAVWVVARRFS